MTRTKTDACLRRIQQHAERLQPWAEEHGHTCYRLYDRSIRAIPLVLDWYDGHLHAAEFVRKGASTKPLRDLVQDAADLLGVPHEKIFFKERKRQKKGAQYNPQSSQGYTLNVLEHNHTFRVNLTDYLDTGLFLDHRVTRRRVQEEAHDRNVLNLFAYTGAFTVYAAAGGARSTTTVDLSKTYTAWTRDNLQLNQAPERQHRVLHSDVMRFLADPERVREPLYDLIVLDPPTFSRSKRMVRNLDIQRDYPWLINKSLDLMNSGGILYFSTNFRDFDFNPKLFRRAAIEELTPDSIPTDFSDRRIHRCWRLVRR